MFQKKLEILLTTRILAAHPFVMPDTQTVESDAMDTTAMQDKVVIITGAARGQGAREAELFASVGARVVATDVRDELGQKVAASLGEHGAYLHHDVTRAEDWQRVVTFAQESFGRVDVLVNNAGVYSPGSIEDTSYESLMTTIQVNQIGVFLGMQSVIAPMRAAGGGAIVNISSGAGLEGIAGIAAYSATKWAVRGLTKCAAKELADDGIRVNSVHPGLIDTPMLDDNSADMMDAYRAMIPLKTIGRTDDVANAVLFLASPAAAYITGAELAIDGGVSA
jgi:3alpha(or 20beta)-hydroxysteroid dehydrogenase